METHSGAAAPLWTDSIGDRHSCNVTVISSNPFLLFTATLPTAALLYLGECWYSPGMFDSEVPRQALLWRHNGRDGVSNHQPHDCLLNRLFRRRSKQTSKLRVTGLCAGNSPGTDEFPAKMASNAENVSIWWRHHVLTKVLTHRVVALTSTYWFTPCQFRNWKLIITRITMSSWLTKTKKYMIGVNSNIA